MGATFEGVTKDGDGQVWADVTVENVSTEVSEAHLKPAHPMDSERTVNSSGTYGQSRRGSRTCL